ncbi:MerR family transcriptional regulator [Virgibacillus sp. DJP39]|uniref:MerR family transcriptional regulator n=1 Tax=Virgibacillus sp. DJP39 TaxID=3409790 RepID=UPI003BB7D628
MKDLFGETYFTISQVALIYQTHNNTIKKWEKDGKIIPIRLGSGRSSHRRYSLRELKKVDPKVVEEFFLAMRYYQKIDSKIQEERGVKSE